MTVVLEGYFVRTLGMHRVYNSAFMHMLMKEDNALYRGAIRSTLHYEPGILKRYVNFMSNPDERTAIDQFGDGDKYFGVATLLATLPGLPMFAHGQAEGFREKYGMEYRRDYHNERADENLVRRHEREIFPLLGLRRLFSQTDRFELYDVRDEHGHVVEDIFAYSNMADGARAVVCYNNRYQTWAGTMKHSAGKLSGGSLRYTTLAEALGIGRGSASFWVFRELRSGLEFLRTGDELHDRGLFVHLRGFQSQVFLDFREVGDPDGSWRALHDELAGSGVHNSERASRSIGLRPLHAALEPVLHRSAGRLGDPELEPLVAAASSEAAHRRPPVDGGTKAVGRALTSSIRNVTSFLDDPAGEWNTDTADAVYCAAVTGMLLAPAAAYGKGGQGAEISPAPPPAAIPAPRVSPVAAFLYDSWLLDDAVEASFAASIPDAAEARRAAMLVRALVLGGAPAASADFFETPAVRDSLGVNTHEGTTYFNKEAFERVTAAALLLEASNGTVRGENHRRMARVLGDAAGRCGYRLGEFLDYLHSAEFLTLTAGTHTVPDRGT